MSHKNHPTCEHNSKAACDKARRVATGQCSSMVTEDRQCPHWGIDRVADRPYCGQHLRSVFLAADEAGRASAARLAINSRIDAYLDKTGQAPHICGARCQFSQIPTTSGGSARSESTLQPEIPLF